MAKKASTTKKRAKASGARKTNAKGAGGSTKGKGGKKKAATEGNGSTLSLGGPDTGL